MRGALGLSAVLALGGSAALQAAVPEGSIEAFIAREMPASGVPGLAYAVVADGEITTVGARGVMKRGADEQVTADTPFLIGSISKSFTALAVMQLVEAKKIDLDTEVSHYLDVFAGRPGGAITIRQLLSHTSGFSTLQGNTSQTERTEARDALAHRVAGVAQQTPAYAPETRWEYSNVNYQVLGRVIEVVSGQDYEAYLEANVLQPIGMVHSFVSDGEIHGEVATGHRPWFGTKRPLEVNKTERSMAPQGGIIASASDLARYMLVMCNGDDDILSASGKAAMMRPASEASPSYGFGWVVDTQSASVWHSGLTPGVETLATMIPAECKGVVVLVNGGSGLGFAESAQLLNGITARALGLDYDGEGSRWLQKALFIALTLMPIVFLLSIAWAWRHRAAIRAKSGAFGMFSLWFPLLTTVAGAWVILGLVPKLFGVPISTLRRFQPDFGLVLIASAASGVLWAVVRLGVAYSGKRAR